MMLQGNIENRVRAENKGSIATKKAKAELQAELDREGVPTRKEISRMLREQQEETTGGPVASARSLNKIDAQLKELKAQLEGATTAKQIATFGPRIQALQDEMNRVRGVKSEPSAPDKVKSKVKTEVKGPVPPKAAINEMVENLRGQDWNKDQKTVFERMLQAENTRELGQIGRKIENEYMADTVGQVNIGTIKAMKKQVKDWLETNGRSGIGLKKAAELEAMTPEERKRASFRDRVESGIRGGVVSGRMR